jgi:DNA-binding response OmpR family regulator
MGRPTRILIVDDDPDICTMIRMMLQYKGYSVTVIDTPMLVADQLRNDETDLVIMDMLLSGFNGVTICRSIKKDNSISHIPLIMMSAHSDAEFRCLEAGANDFISKPFDINELLNKINLSLVK